MARAIVWSDPEKRKEVIQINSYMSWIGGKKALRDEVLIRFPPSFERYIEVCGGAGWVLFRKPPEGMEVFNDISADLVNLYRCVRDEPDELVRALEYVLNAREDFNHIKRLLSGKASLPDVKRAALYYQLIRQSYGSGLKSFSPTPHSMWGDFPLIHSASNRLQRVVIENKDFENLIGVYDREESFFYVDPPYYDTESYYFDAGFKKPDHERLADALFGMEGMFLLSYNDCEPIRNLYSRPGIVIESLTRLNNLVQRYAGGSEYAELLIANYDTSAAIRNRAQISLFDDEKEALEERRIIYHG